MPARPAKVRIVGGSGVADTKVILVETGQELPNVRKVTWSHEVGGLAVAHVELLVCEIWADAAATVCEHGFPALTTEEEPVNG